MPAETQKQQNTAKLAYAYKHGELQDKDVTDSVKQMSKMSDDELKKFMSVKEGEGSERNGLEKAIENKIDFLGDIANGWKMSDNGYEEVSVTDNNILQARNELKTYLPKIKQELNQIIKYWFAGDSSVGIQDRGLVNLEEEELGEINDELDRLYAKYDLAKYMVNLNENTTGDMAVPDMTIGKPIKQNKEKGVEVANQLDSKGTVLKESEGGSFKFTYKLDKGWFEKFKEVNKTNFEFFYDKEDRLYLVYDGDNHILTYNTINDNVFSNKNIEELKAEYSPEQHEEALKEQIEKLTGKKVILL